MRHRIRKTGVRNCHFVLTSACSSTNSLPIPVWGTGTLQLQNKIDKLKRFCTLNRNCSSHLALRRNARRRIRRAEAKTAIRVVPFLGLGISVYLSAHTFLASSNTSDRTIYTPNLGAFYSEGVQVPDLAYLQVPDSISETAIPNAANLLKSPKATIHNKLAKSFTTPAAGYSITSNFGSRIHPIFGDQRFHTGIDIATPSGTPIKAAKAGFVTFADWDGGYGKKVLIDHGDGYETLYAHLDQILVKTGEFVTQKEVIGLSGSTGYVTGPHLHFEIRLYQVAHNPLDYL